MEDKSQENRIRDAGLQADREKLHKSKAVSGENGPKVEYIVDDRRGQPLEDSTREIVLPKSLRLDLERKKAELVQELGGNRISEEDFEEDLLRNAGKCADDLVLNRLKGTRKEFSLENMISEDDYEEDLPSEFAYAENEYEEDDCKGYPEAGYTEYEEDEYEEIEEEEEIEIGDEPEEELSFETLEEEERESRVRKGVGRKKKASVFDGIVAATGVLVVIFGLAAGYFFYSAGVDEEKVASLIPVGREMSQTGRETVEILLAAGEIRKQQLIKVGGESEETEAEEGYEEKDLEGGIHIRLNLTSVEKDLKIKFTNAETHKLVPNAGLTVTVAGGGNKSYTRTDEDLDGIIHMKELEPGDYTVTISEPESKAYVVSTEKVNVTVKDHIEYRKIDVIDEVKKESEVNTAKEDTQQKPKTESTLADTVDFAESSKTEVAAEPETVSQETDSADPYEEVPKDQIPDPSAAASLGKWMRFTDSTGASVSENSGEKSEEKEKILVETIGFKDARLSVREGESKKLEVTVLPDHAGNRNLEWKVTEGEEYARVENGIVTGLKQGKARIRAKSEDGNASAECEVTVEKGGEIKLKLSLNSLTVARNDVSTLTATVENSDNKKVKWSMTEESGGTITFGVVDDTSINLNALQSGRATITAVSEADSSVSASCSVTVVSTDVQSDTKSMLKDNSGNQLYVKEADGSFRLAAYADYYTYDTFYRQKESINSNGEYKYTGWQTMDGKTCYFDKDGVKVTGEQVIMGARYNFGADGTLTVSSGIPGIDVSRHNGSIDWNAVKNAGVSYVIIRCGYRGSTTGALIEDTMFRTNISGALAAGLKVGVYFFTQAVNEVEAVEEASMTLALIRDYKITWPVFLDVEPSGGRADGLDRAARTRVVNAYCQTIKNSGYAAGIYANKNWLTEKINVGELSDYKIWMAHYTANPTYGGTYHMWQYSDKGRIPGISTNVDLNISHLND